MADNSPDDPQPPMENKKRKKSSNLSVPPPLKVLKDEKLTLECPECQQSFNLIKDFRSHWTEDHADELFYPQDLEQQVYECPDCSKTFLTQRQCNRHWKDQHKDGVRNCGDCGESFTDKTNFKQHQNRHLQCKMNALVPAPTESRGVDRKSMYGCESCSFSSAQFWSYQVHWIKDHHVEISCYVCGVEFSDPNELEGHKQQGHGIILPPPPRMEVTMDKNVYFCQSCIQRKGNMSEISYRNHFWAMHGGSTTCKSCLKAFPTYQQWHFHAKTEHPDGCERLVEVRQLSRVSRVTKKPENRVQCDECGNTFCDDYALSRHIQSKHRINLACPECDFVGNTKTDLTQHRRRHGLKCPDCDFRTRWNVVLDKHRKDVHNDDSTINCPLCDLVMRRGNLRTHIANIHEKSLQYVCEDCGKRYSTKGLLSKHIKTKHLKIYKVKRDRIPATCPHCLKVFKSQHQADNHVKTIHDRTQVLTCPQCPKVCYDIGSLKDHYTGNHLEKVKCNYCHLTFPRISRIASHCKKSHPNKVAFKCQTCNFESNNSLYMSEHIQNNHGDEKSPIVQHVMGRQLIQNMYGYKEAQAKRGEGKEIKDIESFLPKKRNIQNGPVPIIKGKTSQSETDESVQPMGSMVGKEKSADLLEERKPLAISPIDSNNRLRSKSEEDMEDGVIISNNDVICKLEEKAVKSEVIENGENDKSDPSHQYFELDDDNLMDFGQNTSLWDDVDYQSEMDPSANDPDCNCLTSENFLNVKTNPEDLILFFKKHMHSVSVQKKPSNTPEVKTKLMVRPKIGPKRRIKASKDGDYLCDGVKVSFVGLEVRRHLDELMDNCGLNLEVSSNMARATVEVAYRSIVLPDPSIRPPGVLVLCGPNRVGVMGFVVARHLQTHGFHATIFVPNEFNSMSLLRQELAHCNLSGIKIVQDIQEIFSQKIDLVVSALEAQDNWEEQRHEPWLIEVRSWVKKSAAFVLLLDPPCEANIPILKPKAILIPEPPLKYDKTLAPKIYMAHLAIPQKIFEEIGVKKPHLFRHKFVTQLF